MKPLGGIASRLVDLVDDLTGSAALPLIEHRQMQRTPVREVVIEASLRDAQPCGKRLDSQRIDPALTQRLECALEPFGL